MSGYSDYDDSQNYSDGNYYNRDVGGDPLASTGNDEDDDFDPLELLQSPLDWENKSGDANSNDGAPFLNDNDNDDSDDDGGGYSGYSGHPQQQQQQTEAMPDNSSSSYTPSMQNQYDAQASLHGGPGFQQEFRGMPQQPGLPAISPHSSSTGTSMLPGPNNIHHQSMHQQHMHSMQQTMNQMNLTSSGNNNRNSPGSHDFDVGGGPGRGIGGGGQLQGVNQMRGGSPSMQGGGVNGMNMNSNNNMNHMNMNMMNQMGQMHGNPMRILTGNQMQMPGRNHIQGMPGNPMQSSMMQGNMMQGNSMQGNSMQGNIMQGNPMMNAAAAAAAMQGGMGNQFPGANPNLSSHMGSMQNIHQGLNGAVGNRSGSLNNAVNIMNSSINGLNIAGNPNGPPSLHASMPNLGSQQERMSGGSLPTSPNLVPSIAQMSASVHGRGSRTSGRTRGPTPRVDANGKVIANTSADPGINEAMEKLCESMRRSAMSRNLVKQLSGRSVQRQGSARSISRSNSGLGPRKQLSGRSLSGNLGGLDDGSGRGTPTRTVPIRRPSDAKHRLHQRAAPGNRGAFRQNSMGSQSSVASGGRATPKTFLQLDDQSLGAL